jgi:hypothetical protein
LRKLLAGLLCVAMAVPAVAIAADDDNGDVGTHANGSELRLDAQLSLKNAAFSAKREAAREKRERRRAKKRAARAASAPAAQSGGGGGAASPALQATAACESGGNPGAVGGGGQFRGKYQFDRATWASVGGSGDPAAAPEAEQDKRAAMLYARAGASPWPNCGR